MTRPAMTRRCIAPWRALLRVAAALSLALAIGCEAQPLILASETTEASLEPRFTTAVYAYTDENTLDIILSDLSPARLLSLSREELLRADGNILHIHQFFTPEAGRTALDPTASNTTVRHIVLAGGEIGVYGGGGMLLPGDTPGGRTMPFRISGASLRLTRATPGFSDRLGGAALSGESSVRRDDESALAMTRIAHQAVTLTEPLPQ